MKKANKNANHEIEPDQIFLDSSNIPEFDTQQFEGRIERPISRATLLFLGFIFLLIFFIFAGRISLLQVVRGEVYRQKSENNRLLEIPIFGARGVIYDRNQIELAWNKEDPKEKDFYFRAYKNAAGLGHLLGYVGHPKKDKRGIYWQKEIFGRDGIERVYDPLLKGEMGTKLIETDAQGIITSEGLVKPPKNGENLTLSIDVRVQEKLYDLIKALAQDIGFGSGAGILMDVETGELLAIVSFPEYDSALLSGGKDNKAITALLGDPRKPFLNRAVSGLYTPGSIVKPYLALGALTEQIITPWKQILSTGFISIPNPYFPDKKSVFNDWKAHGWVDMRRALAVSSSVYFYEIGGGFENQPGLGIENIEKYMRLFGLGERTGIDLLGDVPGIIPNPEWKVENFNGERWFLGNTYHTAIGQYGVQVTPIQMARAVAAIANDGILLTPHLMLGKGKNDNWPKERLDINKNFFKVVKEGMRAAVNEGGTAQGLNMAGVTVAAKTGTAEVGAAKKYVNSWITGFFPYEHPRYAFAVVMERGPYHNTLGGLYVMRGLLDWMEINTPEYLK